MKTFEEKLTLWIDGRLAGAELAAFERELEAHPELLPETDAIWASFSAPTSPPPRSRTSISSITRSSAR
jgi:hypothetical protein